MQQRDDQPCRYSPRCTVHPPLPTYREPRRVTADDVERVRELIAQGYRQRQVADEVGLAQSTVSYIMQGRYDRRARRRDA